MVLEWNNKRGPALVVAKLIKRIEVIKKLQRTPLIAFILLSFSFFFFSKKNGECTKPERECDVVGLG